MLVTSCPLLNPCFIQLHATSILPPLPLFLAASTVPIQCLDDVEKNNNHPVPRASVPRPPSAPPLPSCSGRPCPPSSTLLPDSLREECWYNGPWPSQQCSGEALVGSDTCSVVLPPPPLNQASLDDSSRSFPSPPKPSDAMFWEGHSAASNSSSSMGNCSPRSPPNTEWAKPYWEELRWEDRWWRVYNWMENKRMDEWLDFPTLPHSYHLTCLKLIRPLLWAGLDWTYLLWELNEVRRGLFEVKTH